MSECSKFFIIGTSGLDEDLLQLLDKTIDPMVGVQVDIVGKGEEVSNTLHRFETAIRAFRKMHGTPLMNMYKEGFANYLTSKEFNIFLASPV